MERGRRRSVYTLDEARPLIRGAEVLMAGVVDASTPEEKAVRRRFVTMPSELHRLLTWLREHEVEAVVMESTAQYWRLVWLRIDPRRLMSELLHVFNV